MGDAHRVLPLLQQRRIVDDQDGVRPANQLVGLFRQKLASSARSASKGERLQGDAERKL
jgi:hypothetical protein